MTTDYDPIAEQYKRVKQQPWRTHIEAFSLMELIGPLTGQTVLDVACGDGFTHACCGNKEQGRSQGSISLKG